MPYETAHFLAWGFVGACLLIPIGMAVKDAISRHLAYRRNVREAVRWQNSWDRRQAVINARPVMGYEDER